MHTLKMELMLKLYDRVAHLSAAAAAYVDMEAVIKEIVDRQLCDSPIDNLSSRSAN